MIAKFIRYLVLTGISLSPETIFASDATKNICDGANISGSCSTTSLSTSVGNITETLLTVAGAIAVIIIIVGGLTYITSSGDSSRIKQAKDIILYAVIGLIVAILAYAIVKFVAGNIH